MNTLDKYYGTVVKKALTKTNLPYIVLRLTKATIYRWSRSTKEMQIIAPIRSITHVIFATNKEYASIKHKIELGLTIVIRGQYITVETPFNYAIIKSDGKPVMAQQFDIKTSKYKLMPAISSTIHTFIDERSIKDKDQIIKKQINSVLKHKIG